MKCTNIQMEIMIETLKPLLPMRNKIGYIAARNTRILNDALTEYFTFKSDLISKYGEADIDEQSGKEKGTVSINPDSPNFEEFIKEFNTIKDIEQEVNIMTMPYEETIGILNGEEILKLGWMFED